MTSYLVTVIVFWLVGLNFPTQKWWTWGLAAVMILGFVYSKWSVICSPSQNKLLSPGVLVAFFLALASGGVGWLAVGFSSNNDFHGVGDRFVCSIAAVIAFVACVYGLIGQKEDEVNERSIL